MGLSANRARLNVLTARKADLEYRLMMLTNQSQQIAAKEADAVSKKAAALDMFNAQQQANGTVDSEVSFLNSAAYVEYETAMAELEAADLKLTQQQKAVETEHQAVVAEEEQIQKLVDTNIKNSFGYFN